MKILSSSTTTVKCLKAFNFWCSSQNEFLVQTCHYGIWTQVAHFIVDLLVPNFGEILAPKLEELQTAEIPSSIVSFFLIFSLHMPQHLIFLINMQTMLKKVQVKNWAYRPTHYACNSSHIQISQPFAVFLQ